MDFPHDWVVLAAEEFETAAPRVNGDVTMEVLAQLRPSGRILDNFRQSWAHRSYKLSDRSNAMSDP